jgi:hypothetical protein
MPQIALLENPMQDRDRGSRTACAGRPGRPARAAAVAAQLAAGRAKVRFASVPS